MHRMFGYHTKCMRKKNREVDSPSRFRPFDSLALCDRRKLNISRQKHYKSLNRKHTSLLMKLKDKEINYTVSKNSSAKIFIDTTISHVMNNYGKTKE